MEESVLESSAFAVAKVTFDRWTDGNTDHGFACERVNKL